uniref:Uncharacterized protein n=1 Tax=Rhodnius prolixus TaxID=13249 RepID=T1IAD7_RHOPR
MSAALLSSAFSALRSLPIGEECIETIEFNWNRPLYQKAILSVIGNPMVGIALDLTLKILLFSYYKERLYEFVFMNILAKLADIMSLL